MAVTISGMIGRSYFAGSPVVIDISGLEWPSASPFTVVRVEVKYGSQTVGKFRADTGGQKSVSFDISSALRSMWSEYDYSVELPGGVSAGTHSFRQYTLVLSTEYIGDDGLFTISAPTTAAGGACIPGRLTELERSVMNITDVSGLNGNASTKPTASPERVGKDSMTSVLSITQNGTVTTFYAAGAEQGPQVLRDRIPYTDFIFVNRRGAPETCSALTLEAMDIDVKTQQYSRVERPKAGPSRTLTAITDGIRHSWAMSSGLQTREWAEWWASEFLAASQWWMLYEGSHVPVIVKPSKSSTTIYDRSNQAVPHVDFTVTLALEG